MTTYTWASLNAGTYLYQSGTFPSIEVPMGLYGALVVADARWSRTRHYGHAVDAEAVLLLSEIDPMQNNRVAAAATGLPGTDCVPLADYEQFMTAGYPCTVDYSPTYFLVNGGATADLASWRPGGVRRNQYCGIEIPECRTAFTHAVNRWRRIVIDCRGRQCVSRTAAKPECRAAGGGQDARRIDRDARRRPYVCTVRPHAHFQQRKPAERRVVCDLASGYRYTVVPPPTSEATDDNYAVTEDVPLP